MTCEGCTIVRNSYCYLFWCYCSNQHRCWSLGRQTHFSHASFLFHHIQPAFNLSRSKRLCTVSHYVNYQAMNLRRFLCFIYFHWQRSSSKCVKGRSTIHWDHVLSISDLLLSVHRYATEMPRCTLCVRGGGYTRDTWFWGNAESTFVTDNPFRVTDACILQLKRILLGIIIVDESEALISTY